MFKYCEHCQREFGHGQKASYLEKRRFCSKSCAAQHNQPVTAKKTMICQECDKIFETWNSREGRFCSRKCAGNFGARLPRPETRKPENFVIIYCEYCNNEYTVHKCMTLNGRESRFCSVACKSMWRSENMTGINHPRYKVNKSPINRGSNWVKQRRIALIRDNYKCQICNHRKRIGEKRILDVHHIIPYRLFDGDYLKANELNNLITLCRKCHSRVEHHDYPCPRPLI